jgi:hypothetical protein
MPRNPKLESCAQRFGERQWQQTAQPVRLYSDFFYQARRRSHPRRIAVKYEVTALGVNLRFVITNRAGTPEQIFDWYNQRGQAENFIKDISLVPNGSQGTQERPCSRPSLLLGLPRQRFPVSAPRCGLQSHGTVSPTGDERHRPLPRDPCSFALAPVQTRCPRAAFRPPLVVSPRQRLAWPTSVSSGPRPFRGHPCP